MKVFILIVCIGLLVSLGCASKQPVAEVIIPPKQETPQEPLRIIDAESPVPIILRINDADIYNVTTSTAILEFTTNHPCTADVTVIAHEREILFYHSPKSTSHVFRFTGLQHSVLHTVIIEASASPSIRKLMRFTTATPIPISTTTSWAYYYGGGSYSPSGGTIQASWNSGDGTFSNSVWSINAFAGEVKSCTIAVHNTLGYQITVSLQSLLVTYPLGGENKVSIVADDVIIGHGQTKHITVEAEVKGDAPVGLYELEFSLLY